MGDPRHSGHRVDWVNVAVWGTLALTCLAFWATIVVTAFHWLL